MSCSDEATGKDGGALPLEALEEHLPPGSIARLREIGLGTVREFLSYLVPDSAHERMAAYLTVEPQALEAVVAQARALLGETIVSAIDRQVIQRHPTGAWLDDRRPDEDGRPGAELEQGHEDGNSGTEERPSDLDEPTG